MPLPSLTNGGSLDVPPDVRLRASLAILEAADAMRLETVGSTSAWGVKQGHAHL